MDNFSDKFNAYVDSHPRQSLKILFSVICLIWMSAVCVLAFVLYFMAKIARIQWWVILSAGLFMAIAIIFIDTHYSFIHFDLRTYFVKGFLWNKGFWKLLFMYQDLSAFLYLYHYAMSYVVGFPLLFAGILSAIDLIKDSPHQRMMEALQKGEHITDREELSEKKIEKALNKIDDLQADGVLLGVSTYTGSAVVVPDYFVNQVVLVLGTTGAGKTVTLRRFYSRAIAKGYPLIVVDGKPTNDNVVWLQKLAQKHNRTFCGFNCGDYAHYDPLSNGDNSELKDKIISLKDQWENDYYRSIAEDYLQTTFEVLLASRQSFDLSRVVECLDYDKLRELARMTKNNKLVERVASLESYDRKDITGLQAHLNILIHSAMGEYFVVNENSFTLSQAIQNDAIVYFALPALRYPSFSKVLGKLVINDLKAAIDRNDESKRVFMVFDEFSVFAGDQVLNLVNMGRGKGVHAVFGTQGLADLNTVDVNFKNQILNCANTLICHRLNDQESAETVGAWIGTKDTFTVTAQYSSNKTGAEMGSIRSDKGYVVHPEAIKQRLRTGDAYCVSKVGGFGWEKVRVVCE